MIVSIIIPVYNVEAYVERCLSGLSPLYDNEICEIIIVDDGSTDNSAQICKSYADKFENVILISQSNGGLSSARNTGMKYAHGEYIFFLDSDDRIDSHAFLRAFKFAAEGSYDWVQCGYVYDYGRYGLQTRNIPGKKEYTKADILKMIVSDGYVKNFAWGKFYRTSIIRQHEFPVGKFFEDVLWQYEVIESSASLAIYPEVVTYYYQRNNSISGSFSEKQLDLVKGLLERMNRVAEHYPDLAPAAAVQLWSCSYNLCEMSFGKECHSSFVELYSYVRQQYHKIIEHGIERRSSCLERRYLKSKYIKESQSVILSLLIRLRGRLMSSEYKKIKYDKP